jgi:hypothetical protein
MTDTIARSQAVVTPRHLIDALHEKILTTTNQAHIANLCTYLGHTEAEFASDVDAAMHTLVAEPAFRFWCGYRDPDRPLVLRRPTIRSNYERVFANGFPMIEIVPERFIVSDDGLVLEGQQLSIVGGQQLVDQHVEATPGKEYYCVCRFALLVEFVDGVMVGEDHYWPRPHTVLEIVEDER